VLSLTNNQFNSKAAVLYGQFVKAAYSMYDPATLTPPPSADFPAGYQLTAWINMRDFILGSTDPVFYGFIAQSMTDPNQFVLAIRGTSNGVEWWDDLNAAIKIPFKVPGCGSVGAGFARIYDTLSAGGLLASEKSHPNFAYNRTESGPRKYSLPWQTFAADWAKKIGKNGLIAVRQTEQYH
jgi:hypothetical protein